MYAVFNSGVVTGYLRGSHGLSGVSVAVLCLFFGEMEYLMSWVFVMVYLLHEMKHLG